MYFVFQVLTRRTAELQSSNIHALTDLRERAAAAFKGHADANRTRPTDLPIVIVANKYDTFRNISQQERRSIIQALRFIAHYFGAVLLTVSTSDTAGKDNFRTVMNSICFAGSMKASAETNPEKLVFVGKAQDSFESILVGGLAEGATEGKSKVILLYALFLQRMLPLTVGFYCS
jgi:hypothetical protein